MEFESAVWGPPLAVIAAGGLVAYLLAQKAPSDDVNSIVEGKQADLKATKEEVVEALKSLEAEKGKLSEADYQAEREALLARGSNAMRQLDGGVAAPSVASTTEAASVSAEQVDVAAAAHVAPPVASAVAASAVSAAAPLSANAPVSANAPSANAPVSANAPSANVPSANAAGGGLSGEWKGALYALGAVAVLGVLFFSMQSDTKERGEGASMTGSDGVGGARPIVPSNTPLGQEIARLEGLLASNPNDVDSLVSLTQIYLQVKDPQKSKEYVDKALAVDPKHRPARVLRSVLTATMGMPEKAVEGLDEVLAEDPNDVMATTYKGLVLLGMEKKAEALTYLERSVELDPRNAANLASALAVARGEVPTPSAAGKAAAGPAEVIVSGTATLAPGTTVEPGMTVFLSIKSPQGGPPLAAKKFASTFPLDFEITSADAIAMGGAPRPFPDKVNLTIRVDGDANAMTKEPELPQGGVGSLDKGATGVKVELAVQ